MSFESPARSDFDDSNMIPLINIVFLMLIFFMVAGKVATKDAAQLDVPVADGAVAAHDLEDDLRLILAADRVLWVNDRALGQIDLLDASAWLRIEKMITQDSSVVVKAHASLPASSLDPLWEMLQKNNTASVQLAIRESR
jgi:biopolymer transport protein ExbD